MLHHAQDTLAHKMGSLLKHQFLIEYALKDYLVMFKGPTPQYAITALSPNLMVKTHQTLMSVTVRARHRPPHLLPRLLPRQEVEP